jgi:hypothetical protein
MILFSDPACVMRRGAVMVSFKGTHFAKDVILTCVRWYVAYPLSYRQIEELMQERGVVVDHATINRWVLKYSLRLEAAFHRRKRPVWRSCRMDETYIKVRGHWRSCIVPWIRPGRRSTFSSPSSEISRRPRASSPRPRAAMGYRRRSPSTGVRLTPRRSGATARHRRRVSPGACTYAVRRSICWSMVWASDCRSVDTRP